MATPPSPKRPRQGASPFDIDDSLIDPALAAILEPDEPSPLPLLQEDEQEQEKSKKQNSSKDDPTYQLALERAYADQRFKATMNHIFEKYGRDFDGIGDEIDLDTGEIVVNNGHIRNMRNEADVGDGATEPLEDDEGMYLGDLTDESDEEYQDANNKGQSNEDATANDSHSQQQSAAQSLQPATVSQAPPAPAAFDLGVNMYDPRFMAMLPALYAGVSATFGWGMPPGPGIETQPQSQLRPQQPVPQAFAPPPMPWAPWGMSTDYSMSPWMQPFPTMPQAPSTLPFNAPVQRYNFPVQSGRTSVWARNSRYKDDIGAKQAVPGKRSSVLSSRSRIQHATASGSMLKSSTARTDTDSYDGDEADAEEFLPLQGYNHSQALPAVSDLDEDSDYMWEQQKPRPKPSKQPKKRGRPKGSRSKHNLGKNLEANPPAVTSKIEIKKRQREELKNKLLAKYYEENPEEEPQPEDEVGRRRSGRDRKRAAATEEMVSWDRVKAERRAEYKAMMSIRSDRRAAKSSNGTASQFSATASFESAATTASDKSPTPERLGLASTKAIVNSASESNNLKSSIPDSQELSPSQSVAGSQQVDNSMNKVQEKQDDGYEALCVFSDDEAPAVIQTRKLKVIQPQPSESQDPPSPMAGEIAEIAEADVDIPSGQTREAATALRSTALHQESKKEKINYTELFETDHDYTELLDIFPSSSPSIKSCTLDNMSHHSPTASTPNRGRSLYDNDLEKDKTGGRDQTTGIMHQSYSSDQEPSLFLYDDEKQTGDEPAAPAAPAAVMHNPVLGSCVHGEPSMVDNSPSAELTRSKSSPGVALPNSTHNIAEGGRRNQRELPQPVSKKMTPERSTVPAQRTKELGTTVDASRILPDSQSSTADRQDRKEPVAITSPIITKNLVILSPKPDTPVPRLEKSKALADHTDSAKASRPSSASKRKPSRASSSKRHSLLSLVGDEDEADDLGRSSSSFTKRHKASEHLRRKERKPRPLLHNESSTPRAKKRPRETEKGNQKASPATRPLEPTASGTCGVDGFICGREFCFTCL